MTEIRYMPLPLRWEVLKLVEDNGFAMDQARSSAIERRLARILGEWERTPYDMKFAQKGVGVYCSAFVCRVLDELYRCEPTPLPKIPNDIGFHCREGAVAGLRWFLRQYPACTRLTSDMVQPGDVIVIGPHGGGPGHAMIVGPQENTIWQTTGLSGVHYTGFALPEIYQFHAAFRFMDREVWR